MQETSNVKLSEFKYVLYIDFCKGIPIYIGMGRQARLKVKYRNIKHKRLSSKYGFIREVLLQTNDYEYLQIQEILAIKYYNTFCEDSKMGCNLTKGGEGLSNVCQTVRSKISKAHLGKKLSNTTKQKLKEHFTGVTHSQNTKDKMAKDLGSQSFKVYKNNIYIGTWVSVSQCSKDLGIARNGLRRYFKKLQFQVKGYTFEK